MLKRKSTSTVLLYYAVFALLMTSGGGYLNSIILLVTAALFLLISFKEIRIRSLLTGIILIGYVSFNSIVINSSRFDSHEYIIHVIRILCLTVIIDKIGINEFKKTLVNIMVGLSVWSLVWYTYLLLFPEAHIPFELNGNYVGSYYHIIGFNRSGHSRNAGVFWEPGVFQIYLNLSIAILTIEPNKHKKAIQKFVILVITLMTTMSTGGYLAFAMIMAFALFRHDSSNRIIRKIKGLILPVLILFAGIESFTGIIYSKLVKGGSSFASRHDDFLLGYNIFKRFPLFGAGITSEIVSIRNNLNVTGLLYVDQTELAFSNGLVNIISQAGLVYFIPYLFLIYKRYQFWFDSKDHTIALEMFLLALLALINEPIGFTPFWLSFFFVWSKEDRLSRQDDLSFLLDTIFSYSIAK